MIGCIIQARMGSSRLPGKTLIKLDESRSTLDFVVNQLTFSTLIDKIVIATTNLEQDNIIEKNAKTLGIDCFRGSSDDVLDRYYHGAKKFQINTIVRVTSDCPLIDPQIVDDVIRILLDRGRIDRELWEKDKVIWMQDFVETLKPVYLNRRKPLPDKTILTTSNNSISTSSNTEKRKG